MNAEGNLMEYNGGLIDKSTMPLQTISTGTGMTIGFHNMTIDLIRDVPSRPPRKRKREDIEKKLHDPEATDLVEYVKKIERAGFPIPNEVLKSAVHALQKNDKNAATKISNNWVSRFRQLHNFKSSTHKPQPEDVVMHLEDMIETWRLDKSEFWRAEKLALVYAHDVNGAVTIKMAQNKGSGTSASTIHDLTFISADSAAEAAAFYVTSQIWPTDVLTNEGDNIRFKRRLHGNPLLDWAMHFNEDSWEKSARARSTGKTLEQWFGCTATDTSPILPESSPNRHETSRIYRLLVSHGSHEFISFEVERYLNKFDIKIAHYPVGFKNLPLRIMLIKGWRHLFTEKDTQGKRLCLETFPTPLRYCLSKKLQWALSKRMSVQYAQGDNTPGQLNSPFFGESWESPQPIADVSQFRRGYDPVRDTLLNQPINIAESANVSVEDELYLDRLDVFKSLSTAVQEIVDGFIRDHFTMDTHLLEQEPAWNFLIGYKRFCEEALGTEYRTEFHPYFHAAPSTNLQVDQCDDISAQYTTASQASLLHVFKTLSTAVRDIVVGFTMGKSISPLKQELARDFLVGYEKFCYNAYRAHPYSYVTPATDLPVDECDDILEQYTAPPLDGLTHHKRIRLSKRVRKEALFIGQLVFKDSDRQEIHDGMYKVPWTSRAKACLDNIANELQRIGWLWPTHYAVRHAVFEMTPDAKPMVVGRGETVVVVPTRRVQCMVTLSSMDLAIEVKWPDGEAGEALVLDERLSLTTTEAIQFLGILFYIAS